MPDCDYIIVGGGSAGCVIANRLSEDPRAQVADRAGWRQSQASAGTGEIQLTDHLVASLAAHENFTGLVAHQNRLIFLASAPQQRYFIAHQNPLPQPFLE